MKKVGILTFHHSYSYGACLQALATLMALEDLGYDAELVDYVNEYEQRKRKSSGGPKARRAIRWLRWQLKSRVLRDDHWLRKAFENVDSYYGHRVSQKHYARPEDVDEAEYDVLLAGSDQIWNPRITGHTDPVYLLKHGKAKRRVSYASSIGSVTLSEDEKEVFRECLARFDAVSIRERHAKEQLERATGKQIQVVADPTLLVKPERWSGFAASTATERIVGKPKYAIAFFVGGYTRAYAQRIRAFKTDVRVYNIQKNNRMRAGFGRVLAGVDIAAFLALIRDAEFIATDSYHAVVFSLMLQKKFVPFVNEGNSVRVAELLDRLGLKDRLNDPGSLQREIDYSAVMKRLDVLRAESLDWLRGALEG